MPSEQDFNLEFEKLYKSVGIMTRNWARLEHSIASILSICTYGSINDQGMNIYYSVRNRSVCYTLIDAAGMHPENYAEWNSLRKAIEKEAIQRNNVTHGDFIQYSSVGGQHAVVAISPKIFSSLRRLVAPKHLDQKGYITSNVTAISNRIFLLNSACQAFCLELQGLSYPFANQPMIAAGSAVYWGHWDAAWKARSWPETA